MNNEMIIHERSRDIGNFLVGRLLPFVKKRQVGPFTFIDHMGPSQIGPDEYLDVDQHPHIGLSTLTYLISGEIEHRDSTGTTQVIRPGDVGFMTSGSGVAHTERTPRHLRNGKPLLMHGYQIWVALPKDLEEMNPEFQYLKHDDLPSKDYNGFKIKLIAGEGFGLKSPLKVFSNLFMVDIYATNQNHLDVGDQLRGEIAVVVVQGDVDTGESKIKSGEMLISKTENVCCLTMSKDCRIILFGGEPFPEERYLYWNFVSSRKERLEKAKHDWKNKKFPKVPGDDTYIPLNKF